MIIAKTVTLIGTWYVLHRIAHVIVTEYGIPGGLVACAVIYGAGLVMHRYDL
jgi:hypothetical protein